MKTQDFDFKILDFDIKIRDFDVKIPDFVIKIKDLDVKIPDVDVKIPDFEIKIPDSDVKIPDFDIEVRDFEVKILGFHVKIREFDVKILQHKNKTKVNEIMFILVFQKNTQSKISYNSFLKTVLFCFSDLSAFTTCQQEAERHLQCRILGMQQQGSRDPGIPPGDPAGIPSSQWTKNKEALK